MGKESDNNNSNSDRRSTFKISKKAVYLIIILFVAFYLLSLVLVYFLSEKFRHRSPEQISSENSQTSSSKTSHFPLFETTKKKDFETWKNYRLPTDLLPVHYELEIQPYFKSTERPSFYNGSVRIDLRCVRETSKLVLHVNDLEVFNSTLKLTSSTDSDFNDLDGFNWTLDRETDFFTVELPAGNKFRENHNYSFIASFRGFTKDDNIGFYRASYQDKSNNKKWLIISQLEAIEARKAFISFDEPSFKATFSIRIVHDASLTAMSNMPVKSSNKLQSASNEIGGYEWIETEFETTVKMSTYLVAVLVSDFKCLSDVAKMPLSSKSVTVDVCAREDSVSELEFGQKIAIKLIQYFENHYKIEYPLPKLDHASVSSFKYGAMENFGLAIYLEKNFLLQPNITTKASEQLIVKIISHEISHQWFGNLVTPKWWDDLWLNEGFAKYMEIRGAHALYPEWKSFDQYTSYLMNVIEIDSASATRPISMLISNSEEIQTNIEPIITYGKGSAIVRMLIYILGEDTFDKGITSYLNKFKYQNVDQFDLWDTLNQQAHSESKLTGVNLTDVMLTWTKQKGHPMVNISVINDTHILVKVSPFSVDSAGDIRQSTSSWWIPFSYSVESLGSSDSSLTTRINSSNFYEKIIWLSPNETESIIRLNESLDKYHDKFIVANLDFAGFYRVNYENDNWKFIMKKLLTKENQLSPTTRAQLINDIFSLSRGLYVGAEMPLELVEYLKNENDYLPWAVFLTRIKYYLDMLDLTEINGDLCEYLIELIEPYYRRLGWEPKSTDTWVEGLIRPSILRFACEIEQADCVKKARDYFKEWKNEEKIDSLPQGYKSFILCTAIEHGTPSDFDFVFEQYVRTNDTNVKKDFIYGLSCARETWLLSKLLSSLLTNGNEFFDALKHVSTKSNGYLLAFSFTKNNFNPVFDNGAPSVLREVTKKIKTAEALDELGNYLRNKTPDLLPIYESLSIKTIVESNINWYKQNVDNLKSWFKKRKQKSQILSENFLLPRDLKPTYYDLEIRPYIGDSDIWGDRAFTYEGRVDIYFTCLRPTRKVIFHSKDLQLKFVSFRSFNHNGEIKMSNRFDFDLARDFVIGNLNTECRVNGTYALGIKFTGQILDRLYGFYISSYQDSKNNNVYLATTQFQPTDARRAFPCFDEPILKAKFKITIIRHKNFTSFSNNPIARTYPKENDWEVDEYHETVPMSTYLVAFVVSDFTSISNVSQKGIRLEVAARPQAIANGDAEYALSEACKIMDYFVDYYNVSYPLKKSTQIAIPDFGEGAMENWGLITYRESYLLFNAKTDNIFVKKRITIFISHELSHQWFGNLVTLKSWGDLWLNEGFATWTEYLGANFSNPAWRDIDNFYVESMPTLMADSLFSTRPIKASLENYKEINSLFDSISYTKGASIIRMMNAFLTERTFKKGVSNYLKKYSFSNAEQDDLWEQLTLQAHADERLDANMSIKSIMDTWTIQKGYPVLTLARSSPPSTNNLNIRQKWFLLNPSKSLKESNSFQQMRWFVPVTFTTKEELNFDCEVKPHWFRPEQNELTIELPKSLKPDSWIIGNLQHSGYYRVNYDELNWRLLMEQLASSHELIPAIHRAQLLDDSFNLGKAQIVDQLLFLNMSRYLVKELDFQPFTSAFHGLDYIAEMLLSDYFAFDLFKKFYMRLLQRKYDLIDWQSVENDTNEMSLNMGVVKTMCTFGSQHCINRSTDYFDRWMKNHDENETIPSQYRKVLLQTIIKHGSPQYWLKFYEMAKSTQNYNDRIDMITVLCDAQDLDLLKLMLKMSSNQEMVKKQDELVILINVASNPAGTELAYDYLEKNWDSICERHGIPYMMFKLLEVVTRSFNNRGDLDRLRQFRDRNASRPAIYDAINKAIENVKINIRWVETNFEKIYKWLENDHLTNNKKSDEL